MGGACHFSQPAGPVGFAADLQGRSFARASCRIVSNVHVNDEYKHLVVEAPSEAGIAEPGQFFHLLCPVDDGQAPFLRRPMSIYGIDREKGRLEFLYKIVGKGTRTLSALPSGASLDIVGPLGKGFDFIGRCSHLIQVARGVGLATLAPVSRAAGEHGIRTTAILSSRTPDLVMSVDRLREVGVTVIVVTDSDGSSDPALVGRRLRLLIEEEGGDFLVTCGSNRLLGLVRRLGMEHGIPCQVAIEQAMGCGIGMCFACVREFRAADGASSYRRVCWDGPVFDAREVPSW